MRCKNCKKYLEEVIHGIEWYFSQDDDCPLIKPVQEFCWQCFKTPERFQTFSAYLLTIEYGFSDKIFRHLFHKITKIEYDTDNLCFKYCM